MILDPTKTYLEWNGTTFPNSSDATFKAPAGSTIDWGDGTIEEFQKVSTTVNTHTYTDGKTNHTIIISGLVYIVTYSFYGCNNLTSVNIGNSVELIDGGAFAYCSNLTNVTIPDSVTSISGGAFNNCTSLKSVILSNKLTHISGYTFQYCASLTNITIPDSVISIGEYAFYHCSGLTSVIIGNGVTSIDVGAFRSCINLKTVVLFPETPPDLSGDVIPSTISTIYVQQSSKEAYKTATDWTGYADKIESNDIYLSLIRFNQKNKEYIDRKILEATEALLARITALENK